MTFADLLEKHRQLVSGRIIVGLSTLETLHLSGAFHDLISGKTERWFGIVLAVATGIFGGAVAGKAKDIAGQLKVADVVNKALDTPPGTEPPPEVVKLATVIPEAKP